MHCRLVQDWSRLPPGRQPELAGQTYRSLSERRVGRMLAIVMAGFLAVLALFPAAGFGQSRQGGTMIEFLSTEVVASDNQYVVNASLAMQPNPRLEELVNVGVAVPFIVEFTLERPRWYWLNETVLERTLELRLSYHALTRQYRLNVGGLHRSFGTYDEALRTLLAVRNWAVTERGRLRPNESYEASLRFRLNLTQLPKPFQVAALGSRDLDLSTGWTSWTFLAGLPAR